MLSNYSLTLLYNSSLSEERQLKSSSHAGKVFQQWMTLRQRWNRITGQRVTGSAIWVRVGSGHGSKPWPGFLTRILVQCCEKLCIYRQSISFIIIMRYRWHWHISHKTSTHCKLKCKQSFESAAQVVVFFMFSDSSVVQCRPVQTQETSRRSA